MFMSRYLLFMNYYSFFWQVLRSKGFLIDAVNRIYPLTMTIKTIMTNIMMVITMTTIMKNIMLIKIANLIYPLILATLSMP